MSKSRLFLDIHAIQALPPSNVNRDDTGSPKTALYGGVERARVSSQAWKKAMRDYFKLYEPEKVGVRTLELIRCVSDKINELDPSKGEKAFDLANDQLKKIKIKIENGKTKALTFVSRKQIQKLAEAVINGDKTDKEIIEILKQNPSYDIALFGRMLADVSSLNEDASCQVAHAISTHAIENEYDFFTAIDDETSNDHAGAGMLGTIEYNSSTLYRYANIAVHDFNNQMGNLDDTIDGIKLFVEAFSNSMPTGKANTFANQTLPQAVIVMLREDRPVSLVSAFEQPVTSRAGFVEKSLNKLNSEVAKSERFVKKPIFMAYVSLVDSDFNNFGNKQSNLGELVNELGLRISAELDK